MPESTYAYDRTCGVCGDVFRNDPYADAASDPFWSHMNLCAMPGCGEYFCGIDSTDCPYCDGQGYYDDDDEYDSGHPGIHSWDYKPRPLFLGGVNAAYYLGFELEVSADRMNVQPIYDWCAANGHPGMLYVKEDGSVDGFEIVSHPMTTDYFNSVQWDSFFAMLNDEYPCDEEPVGHGLHVHVSRSAFPHRSMLARWSYLINRHAEHVQRVARRENSNWARFTDYPVSILLPYESGRNRGRWEDIGEYLPCGCCRERAWIEPPLSDRITRQFQNRVMPERYQALNMINAQTIEMRVFKSTRCPDEFTSSLHLVAASVDFVRSMQPWHATRRATQWDAFAEYVASHPVFAKNLPVFTGTDSLVSA